MELRCAQNENLTQWSDPIWMYPVYYYRALPYDPVRPWKDYDGKWCVRMVLFTASIAPHRKLSPGNPPNVASLVDGVGIVFMLYRNRLLGSLGVRPDVRRYSSWSTDGCNSTTKKVPCAAGGQLELLTSPVLRGAGTNWVQLDAMFTTNMTKSGAATAPGAITREFVTSGYFGGIPGDPDGGTTRVVTQNNAGPTFWVGKQANGSEFIPFWDKIGAVGHYDYGSLTMARTLGSDPNQVAVNGRRVLIGWIGGGSPASQSLARDLTLSAEYELLQQFVPELQMLRIPGSFSTVAVPTPAKAEAAAVSTKGSLQLEVFASFTWTGPNPTKPFGVTVLGGAANLTVDCTADVASAPKAQGGCQVGVMKSSGPLMPIGTKTVTVHAFVDHSIVETIFNNRTAMVTYAVLQDETATSVALFGLDGLDGTVVTGQLTTWQLKEANNFGPQP